jgi:nitronate monooxygenase
MGTRFMVTREAPIHESVKQAMVDASELDTALIYRSLRNTARVFNNEIAQQVLAIEAQPGETRFEDIRELVSGAKGRELLENGELDQGIWSAGMVVGLIDDIPACEELIQRIVKDAQAIINDRLQAMVIG